MRKSIIILVITVFIAGSCNGQPNKNTNSVNKENENSTNSEEYVGRPIDGGMEYRKGNILYIFRDGALTTIEQLDWGEVDGLPTSYAYIYSDTPKEIIYTIESGDKSQSETVTKITLEKTIFNHKHNSNDGQHTKEYETSTPLDIWIKLSETFRWDKFSQLKSGASEQAHDGMDFAITVKTESGTFSVINYDGDELEEFFKSIRNYSQAIYEKAEEKVTPR